MSKKRLCPMMDEIEACSDQELLRIYSLAVMGNYKGRLDYRISEIIEEIGKRVAAMQTILETEIEKGENKY